MMVSPLLDLRASYQTRRETLLEKLKANGAQEGKIVLFGNFEREQEEFNQESSFYYLTGVTEPGSALVIDWDGTSTIYIPNTGGERAKWIENTLTATKECAEFIGVDKVEHLGEKVRGYELPPFFSKPEYKDLLAVLESTDRIYTFNPAAPTGYVEQRRLLLYLETFISGLKDKLHDASSIVTEMRMLKDNTEIDLLYNAIDITHMAHESAARMINPNKTEGEVQATVDYVFIASAAKNAFPTIAGSAKNSTVLHYTENNEELEKGTLIVVDCGAMSYHYCADITRTYPVGGKFSDRQKELYQMVLDCQQYIADLAKPGMWLKNNEKPEESLHHLAVEFFKKKGMDKYFLHGIGHYLGLDTHDVGDYTKPLEEGNVITIEPGLYVAEEGNGIRIEDNYWIVKEGAVCLSEAIPKSIVEIEQLTHEEF